MPTAHGSRYLQQLCSHRSHDLAARWHEGWGEVVFPRNARGAAWPGDATMTFTAEPDALRVCIAEQRDALTGVVARHLDRFAFREAPLPFAWTHG